MRIRYNRPIKASSDGRKWVNTELTQNVWSQLRPYLIKNGYKFEPSGAGDMVHIECYLNEAEINKVDKFIDTIADDIGASCRSKSSVKSSTSKRRAVKAEYRDNTIDKDAVRELVLTITNDGDLYRRQITPAIDNLKRKYKKGNYDRDKAVKLWQYVADEGVRRYNKEFGSGTYSVAWLNPITRKAIAEELRDYYEDEIMYEDNVESACGKKSVKASEQAEDVVFYYDRKKIYEGPLDRGFYDATVKLCQDPENNEVIMEYCNSFGDPFDFDGTPEGTAEVFVWLIGQDYDETTFMGEDSFYAQDSINGHDFEIFPASQEITSSVKRGKKSVKASYGNNVSASKIQKFIEDSIADLQNSSATNCRLVLDDDLCLYVGYSDGFDTEDGYGICTKIAERNDVDWADFDYLNMPWNTYSDNDGTTGIFEGDVYDTNIEITPGSDYSSDAQWLADSYAEIRNLLDEGKLAIEASTNRRGPVKASRTLEIFTFDELTPEQQEYVLSNWSDMNKLSNRIYEWYNEDLMLSYPDEIQYIADQYAGQYGLSINPDKIYWQSNSQGPYPEWDLSQVLDEYQLNDGTEIYFYGRGLDVEAETDSWGEEVESPEIDEVVGHAQEFIDKVWDYINAICQSYPDDEWVRGEFEANPDAWEFTVGADGTVKYY